MKRTVENIAETRTEARPDERKTEKRKTIGKQDESGLEPFRTFFEKELKKCRRKCT